MPGEGRSGILVTRKRKEAYCLFYLAIFIVVAVGLRLTKEFTFLNILCESSGSLVFGAILNVRNIIKLHCDLRHCFVKLPLGSQSGRISKQ
jgi:hypothetical protein